MTNVVLRTLKYPPLFLTLLVGLPVSAAMAGDGTIPWPARIVDCAPLTARAVQEDALAGQWRYYQHPWRPSRCLLLSYQAPWDKSKPVSMQVMPMALPEPVIPYLTQHATLSMTLPSRGGVEVDWLHLGYAADLSQYRRYQAILSQPALAPRANEVMAWQTLARDWPASLQLTRAERLAHADLTAALLLAYPQSGEAVVEQVQALHGVNNAHAFYHYLDALQQLREQSAKQRFGRTSVTPQHDDYLPTQSAAVYARMAVQLEKTPPKPVSTFSEAAEQASALLLQR